MKLRSGGGGDEDYGGEERVEVEIVKVMEEMMERKEVVVEGRVIYVKVRFFYGQYVTCHRAAAFEPDRWAGHLPLRQEMLRGGT
ncbi:hypothetical protein Pmani_019846 [Petrolisthes manimaculis]|uniref:Uncharacterized protein n=1 Tax=Petrolisthes manimaculis TaxID=1843537 RepID=A0AAE1U6Z0_9EUCA|nr:hypothetical protein Pmani_019846 [Petrolisthes manimaculis]